MMTDCFTVVEQTEAGVVLAALKRSLIDCADVSCAVEIGRLLSASRIFIGIISKIETRYIITVKLVDVGKGICLKAETIDDLSLAKLSYKITLLVYVMTGITPAPDPVKGEMVLVTKGSFRMGSNESDAEKEEKPMHTVELSRDFLMGRYEVTVGEFRKFINNTGYVTEAETGDGAWIYNGNIWERKPDADWENPYLCQTEKHPVVCVSFNDAIIYCNWKSEQEDFEPCYSGSGNNIACDFSKNGYRLPTEAEWEFAARGRDKSKGITYAASNYVNEVA